MTVWSTEEIVDAAIETLGAQLEPALTQIYADRAGADLAAGREIEMRVPKPGLREAGGSYYAGAASTIIDYPAIEVALPDLNMTNFDLGMVDADVTENLVVVAWEQAVDMQILYRRLTRLLAAVYDVLIPERAIASAEVQTVRAAWRWNPETNERDEITSGALAVFGLASTRVRP